MTDEGRIATVVLTAEDAIRRLSIFTNPCEECQREMGDQGCADHTVGGHKPPREVTHAYAGTLGAEWDIEEAREFLRTARRIVETPAGTQLARFWRSTGHGLVAQAPDGLWKAFATTVAPSG